jgi:curved DNA-binding protein CbpA
MNNLYEELEVERDATPAQIKSAYRKLVKKHHPDKGGDAEKFNRVQLAFDVLSNPARRTRYDRTGRTDEIKVTPQAVQSMISQTVVAIVNAQRPDGSTDDPTWDNIKQRVLTTIRDGRRGLHISLSGVNKRITRLDKLAKRFKSKTKEDPVGDAFAELRESLIREKHQLDDAVEMNLALEKIFMSYDYEVGPGSEGHDNPSPTIRLSGPRYTTSIG